MLGKNEARSAAPAGKISGRALEILRHLEVYRAARRVMISPGAGLRQARINALSDGKELVVPAPGLKEGFYLLKPYALPFRKIGYAASYNGLLEYGLRPDRAELCRIPLGLLITDCLAVDRAGYFVGDGKGLFDLAVAILAEGGALAPAAEFFSVGEEGQVLDELLIYDQWDVRLNGFVAANGPIFHDQAPRAVQGIIWNQLSPQRIRKISPLWKLAREAEREESSSSP